MSEIKLERLDANRLLLPQTGGMRVPGIIYANDKISALLEGDESAKQVANVAHLPGIVNYSLAMPDVHWGYGFPIGGVAAFDLEEGIVSPGGVGYDINCGCRLMATKLSLQDIKGKLRRFDYCSISADTFRSRFGRIGEIIRQRPEESFGRRCRLGGERTVLVWQRIWKQPKMVEQ